jgi:hypothetical protein
MGDLTLAPLRENAGSAQVGWMHFQPLWQEICRTDPELFE